MFSKIVLATTLIGSVLGGVLPQTKTYNYQLKVLDVTCSNINNVWPTMYFQIGDNTFTQTVGQPNINKEFQVDFQVGDNIYNNIYYLYQKKNNMIDTETDVKRFSKIPTSGTDTYNVDTCVFTFSYNIEASTTTQTPTTSTTTQTPTTSTTTQTPTTSITTQTPTTSITTPTTSTTTSTTSTTTSTTSTTTQTDEFKDNNSNILSTSLLLPILLITTTLF